MTPQPPPPTDALTPSSKASAKLSAPRPYVLHIGAGRRKIVGAVTLDINPALEPDVVWDLNQFPYPFPDDTFDTVVCEHVIEHLQNVIGVMEELHRVSRPGAKVWVRVPHFSSLNFNTDPTHIHAFSSRSFNYLCEGEPEQRYGYSTVTFRKLVARMDMRPATPFNRLLMRVINRILPFYEEHLAYIIPGQELLFVLEVVK
ncbi:MAG: class I SAM-dependent methyltransferase [Chloroflexota bacterium]|nr:class I SAM-dependent methyltransferase [Chloroflexota bacterium]